MHTIRIHSGDASFDDIMQVIDSLSETELKLMDMYGKSSNYEDSPYVVYRNIATVDNEVAGFIEVSEYPDNQDDNSCNIAVAVNPNYRGHGVSKKLIQKFLRTQGRSYNTIYYDFNQKNIGSKHLVESIPGFKYVTTQDGVVWYAYQN